MQFSVIIPAFNEEQVLEDTLSRLASVLAANNLSAEIIVCDNNSTDSTAAIASRLDATVVHEPVNQISRARNTGAAAAGGEWLLFLDADSHPPPELLAETFALIEGGRHIGCGSTVKVVDGSLFNKLRMERLNPLFRLFGLCGGAYLLCRADAFRAIGGFSTALFALEEIDFVLRLKRHGRGLGKRFAVLHRHPVVTSGRKGELQPGSLVRLVVANVAAVFLLLLSFVLPKRLMPKAPQTLLSYWYRRP